MDTEAAGANRTTGLGTSSSSFAGITAVRIADGDIKQEIKQEEEVVHRKQPTAKAIVKKGKRLISRASHRCSTCGTVFGLLADYLTHVREHKEISVSRSNEKAEIVSGAGCSALSRQGQKSLPNILKGNKGRKTFGPPVVVFRKDRALNNAWEPRAYRQRAEVKKRKKQKDSVVVSQEDDLEALEQDEIDSFGQALTDRQMFTLMSEEELLSSVQDIIDQVSSSCATDSSNIVRNETPENSKSTVSQSTGRQKQAGESDSAKFQKLEYQQYNPAVDSPDVLRNAFACSVCGEKFVTIRAVNQHERTMHPDWEEQPLRCNLCDQVLKNRRSLRSHEIRLHSMPAARELKVPLDPKIGTHRCTVCEPTRAFDTDEQLEYHNEMFHPSGIRRIWVRQYGCEDCGDIFNDLKALARHREAAHDFRAELDEQQKYPCPSCSASFERPYKLAVHRREKHDDGTFNEAYHCHICNKGFKTKCGINSHVESAHSEKGPMPFQCQHCARRYATKHNWRKHVKSHLTGPEYLICSGCGKRYLHTNSLQFHQRSCDGYKAVTRLELDLDNNCEHRVVEVDGMQQFECKVCNHVTKSRSGFAKHYKNAHFAMEALPPKEQETLVKIYAEAEAE